MSNRFRSPEAASRTFLGLHKPATPLVLGREQLQLASRWRAQDRQLTRDARDQLWEFAREFASRFHDVDAVRVYIAACANLRWNPVGSARDSIFTDLKPLVKVASATDDPASVRRVLRQYVAISFLNGVIHRPRRTWSARVEAALRPLITTTPN
ncbi:MAG: hypothetical protein R3B57_01665 [Phycisphaerales bacterium]